MGKIQDQKPGQCKYKVDHHQCEDDAQDGHEFCLFHRTDRTPEEDQEFVRKVHGKLIELQLASEDDQKSGNTCRFWGYQFPPGFDLFVKCNIDGHIECRHAHFAGDADFRDSEIKGYVDFEHAVIDGKLDFWHAKIGGRAIFKHIHVGGDVSFRDAEIGFNIGRGGADFSQSVMGGQADFEAVRVSGSALFYDVKIAKGLNFSHTEVDGPVSFARAPEIGGDATFSCAHIRGGLGFNSVVLHGNFFGPTTVGGELTLQMTKVGGGLYLIGTRIEGSCDLVEAQVAGDTSVRLSQFRSPVDFSRASFSGAVRIEGTSLPPSGDFVGLSAPQGRAASLCRFAKQVSLNMGRSAEAGDWYYQERRHSLYAKVALNKKWIGKVWSALWPVNLWQLGMGLVWGWAERPGNVVITSVLVILAFAGVYSCTGGLEGAAGPDSAACGFLDAVYVSALTFSTYGFGEFGTIPAHNVRYMIACEALLGAVLIAMFIVALARRYGRG